MNSAFDQEGGAPAGDAIDARVDTGTIAWLLPEIVLAFDAASTALRQFRAGAAGVDRADVDLAPLRVARSHLHQAHGALEISEIAGVTRVSEAIEELAALFETEPGHCDATALDAIIGGCRTIVEYLEDLQRGAKQQPLYLFPSYRELLAARGADRIHPADLFLVDVGIRAPRDGSGQALGSDGLSEQRSLFEQALLRYIRDETDAKALTRLCRAVTAIDGSVAKTATSGQSQQRAFWWVTRALFEALANEGFAKAKAQHRHLKRLAGRVNLQIRRLVDGSGAVAERLFADVLFFVAIAEPVTQHVKDVQARYRLVGALPADFEVQRYGRIDAVALKVARDALGAAKSAWAAVVAGDVKQIHDFAKQTAGLHDAMGAIGRRGLAQVAQVIDGIATDLGFDPRQPPAAVGLDVATALLFIEGALERARTLDGAFDERAELVVARLEASALGQEPTAKPVDWLDRMAREAEERLTVATFVAELQANLRSAEKELDAFFRDPGERAGLANAQAALVQASGALALLGHDDVHRAIDRARETITRFQQATATRANDSEVFEELAQTLGAVGFYVEQIKRDRIDPNAFHYDPESGRFSVEVAKPAFTPEAEVETTEPIAESATDVPARTPDPLTYSDIAFAATQVLDTEATLEEELALRAADASEHALRLRNEPGDRSIRVALSAAVDDVRRHAALIDDRALQDEASAVLVSLRQTGEGPMDMPAVTDITDRVVALAAQARRSARIVLPSALPAEPTVAVPAADNVEAIDAELLEIFLEEADTVLVDAEASLRVLDADPVNATATVNLRRNFHTLKGSSRMVGLMAFGEAGWAIEDTLNSHIADQVGASNDLRALIEYAIRYLGAWVEELRRTGQSSRDPDALIEAARALRAGTPPVALTFPAPADARPAEPAVDEPSPSFDELPLLFETDQPASEPKEPHAAEVEAAAALDVETPTEGSPTFDWLETPTEQVAPAADPAPHAAPVEAPAPTVAAKPASPGDDVRHIGPLTLSVPLFNIYLSEADELLRVLTQDFAEWRHELDRFVSENAMRAAHSLAGSSATVGLLPAHDLAAGVEDVLLALYREPIVMSVDQVSHLQDAVESLRRMLHRFAAERMPDHDPVLLAALVALKAEILGPDTASFAKAPLVEEPIDTSDEEQFDVFFDPPASEAPVVDPIDTGVAHEEPTHPETDEAPEDHALPEVAAIVAAVDEPVEHAVEHRVEHPVDHPVEPAVEHAMPTPVESQHDEPVPLVDEHSFDAHHETIDDEGDVHDESAAVVASLIAADEAATLMRRAVASERESNVKDDIDPDLLDVFVEEGNEILPQIATLLRTWQAHRDNPAPARTLLRHLHTLKGSARMAGAMRLGEVVHDMEARIEAAARLHEVPAALVDELLGVHDRSLELFDELQNREEHAPLVEALAVEAPVAVVDAPSTGAIDADVGTPVDQPIAAAAATVAPRGRDQKQATQQVVRVQSETLDRLVNLAGEVSISRARIENELMQIKGAMGDLSDNVERLRGQLREIELQAEVQMQSQMQSQQTAGQEREKFDPLEFDRFTRFQELTRMMAESVNDVKTIQQNLQKSLEIAEVDLTLQRRMTRDLQQDLMAVRMVPFSSIAERLYRVARRASKEVDKRVNLDIRGGTVEMDRSVLERMAGPFEHLLRNHIVHGIESRDVRRSRDKSETGELLVEVRQEGNEIVLTFSDDGAGLDYDRIRSKGRELGLVGDESISDAQAAELIFSPGFSTAAEVTELAGRGVGMDVVREETIGLAGRIAIDSDAGKGTRFTITLPLTLAVTQVVLVAVANRIHALPSVLVEQVQQLRPQALADAYRAGELDWDGTKVRLAFLGSLLGIDDIVPVAQRTSPVLLLRSAGERLAVHVDTVIGNQEVVVKNLGPQLSRMTGIAGATVLGSGEIVLILNPVQLSQMVRSEEAKATDAASVAAAVTATDAGLKTLPTVMVVDDSLTVRRVTQRLLSREGYQVVLAKDGVDALEQLQDYPPDVMLVDIEMPRMDGFDLTRNVRNDERYRHIPIIMITSRTAEKHRQHAAELGVDAYLGKPYQEDELLDLLMMHVQARRVHPA